MHASNDSIGLSGHKNEYKAGVRIGNWVEELYGSTAAETRDSLKEFMARQQQFSKSTDNAHRVGQRTSTFPVALAPVAIVDPKPDETADTLFSHGPVMGVRFNASMNDMHYCDPELRAYGAMSDNRVHKTHFYGSKHVDAFVPFNDPYPRTRLMDAKAAEWAATKAPRGQLQSDQYVTSASAI